MRSRLLACAVSAVLAGAALDASAAEQVDTVSLQYAGGITMHVTLGIVNGAKTPGAAVVAPLKSSMDIELNGYVKCDKQSEFKSSALHFGLVTMNGDQVNESGSVYEAAFGPTVATWAGLVLGWITEAGDSNVTLPLAQLKNGPAAYKFDPVAEFEKLKQEFVANGGSALEFMQKDHFFQINRPMTLVGVCRKKSGSHAEGAEVKAVSVPIGIKYVGDPSLFSIEVRPGLNAGNTLQVYQDLILNSGEILPYAPHYVGACPAQLKFRVRLKGTGEGQVIVRLTRGNVTQHDSQPLQFANGELNYEYTYNLPYFGPAALGNKVDNLFKLYVKTKSKDAQAFPAQFHHLDDVVWSYTCIAKPTVNLGGQGGITTGGNNAPAPGPAFQAQPASPPPPPAPGFKVVPQAPQPPAAPSRVTP